MSSIKLTEQDFLSTVIATNVKRLLEFKSKLGLTELINFMNVLPRQLQWIEYNSANSFSGRQLPVKKSSLQYDFSLQIKHQWLSKIKITI